MSVSPLIFLLFRFFGRWICTNGEIKNCEQTGWTNNFAIFLNSLSGWQNGKKIRKMHQTSCTVIYKLSWIISLIQKESHFCSFFSVHLLFSFFWLRDHLAFILLQVEVVYSAPALPCLTVLVNDFSRSMWPIHTYGWLQGPYKWPLPYIFFFKLLNSLSQFSVPQLYKLPI